MPITPREREMITDIIRVAYKEEILPIPHDDCPVHSNTIADCPPETQFRIELKLSVRAVDTNNSEALFALQCHGNSLDEIGRKHQLSRSEVDRRIHKLLYRASSHMDYSLRQRCLWAWPQLFYYSVPK